MDCVDIETDISWESSNSMLVSCIHFRTIVAEEGMNSFLALPAMG